MESLFASDDIIFILYIFAFAEQIHDLCISKVFLNWNNIINFIAGYAIWNRYHYRKENLNRKPKYNLVYHFKILFMRMRLNLKTPSMLRIGIELIYNNTTEQTYEIRFPFEASWAISIYWWYADYLFLNRMSECCNLSPFKFLFIAST